MYIKNKVSVIIATLNCEKTIEQAINSSLCQNYENLEVIIADGGSVDGTIDIVKSFKNKNLIKLIGKDNGIYDAWNKSINISSGEWVCFIGGDDYWLNSNCISSLIINSKNANFISAKVKIFNELTKRSEIIGKKFDKKKILKGMFVAHPGSLHHINLFEEKKFKNCYKISADHEFLINVRGKIMANFLNEQIVCMRDGGVSRKKPFLAFYESFCAIKSNVDYGIFYAFKFYLFIVIKFIIRRFINLIIEKFKRKN